MDYDAPSNDTDNVTNSYYANIKPDGRYMLRLYVEVLKMIGLRGFYTIHYQLILDNERTYDLLMSRGQVQEAEKFLIDNAINDEAVGKFLYENRYCSLMGINPKNVSLRTKYNSIFFDENGSILVVVFTESDAPDSGSIDMARSFVETLKQVSNKFFGTTDYCNLNVSRVSGILVTKVPLTSTGKTWTSCINNIDIFLDADLSCSISENIFCSKRVILSPEEKKQFEYELDASLSKIPSIPLIKDLSYRFSGVKKDQIVKEERTSIFPESINQKSIQYRLCK